MRKTRWVRSAFAALPLVCLGSLLMAQSPNAVTPQAASHIAAGSRSRFAFGGVPTRSAALARDGHMDVHGVRRRCCCRRVWQFMSA